MVATNYTKACATGADRNTINRGIAQTAWQWLSALVLTMLCVLPAHAQQGSELTAFVDRTDISVNDIFTLTIRVGAQLGEDPPSLTGLNDDFDRLGTTISSQYTSINGQVEQWNEFRITLKPKATGRFVIPAFRKGNAMTQPITINVGDAEDLSGASSNEIFLRTSLSKESVYVQEQLVYTIKLYYSIRFDQGGQLTNPQVQDAVVQQLASDQTYQEIVEGIRYDVTERKFVIFPQKSGELVIPPVNFTATIGGRSGISRLLSRNTPVRQINLASDAYTIEVKGIPADFDGTTWLPARNMTIEEEWSAEPDNLDVGESVTRNLTLRVEGLSSSLLPAIRYEAVDGLRFYPDQPNRRDSIDQNGVVGVRAEGTAIVPAEPGEFTLPETRLAWWNVIEDRMEYATVPARNLTVTGGMPASVQPAPQLPQQAPPGETGQTGTETGSSGPASLVWMGTTALFGLGWLITMFLLIRTRQRVTAQAGIPQVPSPRETRSLVQSGRLPKPENSLRYLQQASESGDLKAVRRWALSWGQAFFDDAGIKTLDQLKAACGSESLGRQLTALELVLYSNKADPSAFDAKAMVREIITINKKGPVTARPEKNQGLPPLYKN